MPKQSAGLLLYRRNEHGLEVFLVHPGGPHWSKKDLGAWSIPKGEYTDKEDPLSALGSIRQAGGKVVSVWALEGDCDPAKLNSNLCTLQWPPRSGKTIEFPEVDKGAWFSLHEAQGRILASQAPMLHRLAEAVDTAPRAENRENSE
jgi:predicted NUDIX family NTP pyrophosphohydrolase